MSQQHTADNLQQATCHCGTMIKMQHPPNNAATFIGHTPETIVVPISAAEVSVIVRRARTRGSAFKPDGAFGMTSESAE
jgi:hypothetical protein